jgi:glucose/arabinose dehydrogenase
MRILTTALALGLVLPAAASEPWPQDAPNTRLAPAFEGQTRAPMAMSGVTPVVETFATGLENPWGIAALPEGGYLVTERPGRLRVVAADGEVGAPVAGVPRVRAERQGGLLDVALDRDFATNRVVYLSYSKPVDGNMSVTAVARGVLSEDMTRLDEVQEIFEQTPPSPTPMHYGSRIVPAPDGTLFVTLGERSSERERVLAQDTGTTYGKVVRVATDGAIPPDNPLVGAEGLGAIWSWGHRNPQGATLAPDGSLWVVEHGPRGGDELNRVEPGLNYGWPVISYGINYGGSEIGEGIAAKDGMEQPVYYWDPVIAPGGMLFYDGAMFPEWQGDLLIASLNPGGLVRLIEEDGRITGEERFLESEDRIRDVEVAPDGSLLLLVDASRGVILRVAR